MLCFNQINCADSLDFITSFISTFSPLRSSLIPTWPLAQSLQQNSIIIGFVHKNYRINCRVISQKNGDTVVVYGLLLFLDSLILLSLLNSLSKYKIMIHFVLTCLLFVVMLVGPC